MQPDSALASRPIGVFDSGVGGLSVLRQLLRLLPQEDFVYLADTAWAPYGERSTEEIQQRSLAITRRLLETPRQIDVERARYTTQSYQASEGEAMAVRRAKMLLHLADQRGLGSVGKRAVDMQSMAISVYSGE